MNDDGITICTPGDCSPEVINKFVDLICSGGAIPADAKIVEKRVRSAKFLAFVEHEGAIVGTAALKIPEGTYRDRIGKSAGFQISAKEYPFELGYVVVSPSMKGRKLSYKLVCAIVSLAEGKRMFSTTSNPAMHKVLPGAGFVGSGQEYENKRGEKLTLYVT